MNQSILTAQPASMTYALGEMARADASFRLITRMGEGIALIAHESPFDALGKRLLRNAPIFAQHLCPVCAHLEYGAAMERLTDALEPLLADAASPVALQMRYADAPDGVPDKRAVTDAVFALLSRMGLEVNNRAPETVISVLAGGDGLYVGVSQARLNINPRGGRAHGFERFDEKISRSELKLLEAIETFGLTLPSEGRAIDLGAAPGGWSHALAEMGMNVDAVDPAVLDGYALSNARISHYRMTAQQYLPHAAPAALIVNDMKMDAFMSARLMLDFKPLLAEGGIAVMTLKLPREDFKKVADAALKLLGRGYALIGARQLYNNRSEITVALRVV